MDPQNWKDISNAINLAIFLNVVWQLWETTRTIKGKGLFILLAEVPILGVIPWIIFVFIREQVTFWDVFIPIGIGILLAIPFILFTKFIVTADGRVKYNRNLWLYLFLIGIPIFRKYFGFSVYFDNHPIINPDTHIPNIELMVVMYVTVIVVNTYMWRLVSYSKFRRLKRELAQKGQ